MVPNKLEMEADSDCHCSMTTESSSLSGDPNQDTRYSEPKRKVKKLRSINLVKLPSLKMPVRREKLRSDSLFVLSSDAASSEQSTTTEISDASPNYMKMTSSPDAKKDSFQNSARTLARRSSFKPAKSLARLASTKFRRPLMWKSSGGADLKKKLKKSRSIKHVNLSSSVLSSEADTLPHYLKATSSSGVRNVHLQASSPNSEFSLGSIDKNRKSSINSKLNLAYAGNKSERVITRTSTLRPVRILTKIVSIKAKRPSMKECSQIPDSSIQKATCSSILKDSKFLDNLELQPGGSESEGKSAMKICPYSYCSLHGHRHSDLPPLKRFVSIRRRALKNQKSTKLQRQPSRRVTHPANKTKGVLTRQNADFGDPAVPGIAQNSRDITSVRKRATPEADLSGDGSQCGDREDTSDCPSAAEIVFDEASYPCQSSEETLQETSQFPAGKRSIGVTRPPNIKHEDCEQDCWILPTDSGPESIKKQKQMGLWRLIYQHMATGIAAEVETQSSPGKMGEEEQGDDANTMPEMNTSLPCPEFSGAELCLGMDSHDGSRQKIQLYQYDAIKLVQEAFDKLLSEISYQSSDDQSINGDKTSEEEHTETNHSEGGDLSITTLSGSCKHGLVHDTEEIRLKAENASDRVETESKVGNMSNQRTPKGWSNLKKIIVLQKFVKVLEKVRKIKPRKPQYLPVEPDPEAEKIHLRPQTMEERKKREEWMLDYALQHVISTLAPAQKRKVALLVEAFETVTPVSEISAHPRSSIGASPKVTPVRTCTGASDQQDTGNGKQHIFGVLRKTSCLEINFQEDQKKVEEHMSATCSKFNDTSSGHGSIHRIEDTSASKTTSINFMEGVASLDLDNSILKKDQPDIVDYSSIQLAESGLHHQISPEPADSLTNAQDEFSTNAEIQGVTKEVASVSASELNDRDIGFIVAKLESNNQTNGKSEQTNKAMRQILTNYTRTILDENAVSSASHSEQLEESSESTVGESNHEDKFPEGLHPPEESQPSGDISVAHVKQKNMSLSKLIYKHMVSGSAAVFEAENKEEQGEKGSALTANNPQLQHDSDVKNDETSSQKVQLQQIEAIRLVEEAIDEIPLPDFEENDSLDDQSVATDMIPDQEHLERQAGDGGELFASSPIHPTKESFEESNSDKAEQGTRLDIKDSQIDPDDSFAPAKSNIIVAAGNKPKQPAKKSWSNLKKLILLKRFVKALEKVKKFNPREPHFLPLDTEKETEKVHLRHQETKDRKNADEPMLDYALQQVVAKLTPARKRRVQLLVEAFETVMPTIGSSNLCECKTHRICSTSIR